MHLNFTKSLHRGILVFTALVAGYSCSAQTLSTVAGTGAAGYNGDDEPATATQLWSPAGIALGGGGVYVADGLNNRIRVVSSQGKVSTIAGVEDPGSAGDGGPATDGQLSDPEGIAIDGQGNVYIADKFNNSIRKITPAGVISTVAGTGEAGYSGDGGLAVSCKLNGPTNITFDRENNMYITDAGNNCIRMMTQAGEIMTIAGTGKAGFNAKAKRATMAMLNAPRGVAVDSIGNIYIADALNYVVRKVTPTGDISTVAGTNASGYSGNDDTAMYATLNMPTGVALDKGGNIYIADQGNNCIRKINTEGIISTVPITQTDSAGRLVAPLCIVIDGGGNIYVSEQRSNRVRKITPAPPVIVVKKKKDDSKPYVPPPFTMPGSHFINSPVRPMGNQPMPTNYGGTPVRATNKG